MGTLVLVRHGESLWNKCGRYQGHKDIRLSEAGIRQAELLAQYFREWHFDAVFSSDLSRARETAAVIAKYHLLPVTVDPRLREYALGAWEGLTRDEVKTQYPEVYAKRRQDIDTAIPGGGETGAEVRARVMDWLQETAQKHSGLVLAVSHGGTIRTLFAAILELEYNKCRLILSNGSYSIIHWWKEQNSLRFVIEAVNRLACFQLL